MNSAILICAAADADRVNTEVAKLLGDIRIDPLSGRTVGTAMTDAQITACRALCAIKSGVTL